MPLPVLVTFPGAPAPLPPFQIDAWRLDDGVSRLFELTLSALLPDPALPLDALVGQMVDVSFTDQPFLPRIKGIVARARQLTAETTGLSRYELVVVPRLWLATRRRGYAIFQEQAVPEIADVVLASVGAAPAVRRFVGNSPAPREYTTLYEETAEVFLFRLLAEEGLSLLLDHGAGGAVLLMDDTALGAPVAAVSLPWNPSNLTQTGPSVRAVEQSAGLSFGATRTRHYDADNPYHALGSEALCQPLYPEEDRGLWHEWAEGLLRTDQEIDSHLRRGTELRRAEHEGAICHLSHAVPPGTRLTVVGHPGGDREHFVTRLRAEVEEVGPTRISQRFMVDTLPAALPFRAPSTPKPRVTGTQTAVVVSRTGKAIDVDAQGRIEVGMRWDTRGPGEGGGTSRRVRVARPWAGPVRGFTAFPRVGDEVVLTFLDGDPDRPLVVGCVHHAAHPPPQQLPGQETVTTWRSASTPGGDGYNEVKMDDAEGAEKLELRAERDYRLVVGRDSETVVAGERRTVIEGSETTRMEGGRTESIAGDSSLWADGKLGIGSGGDLSLSSGTELSVVAPTIRLSTGAGASLTLEGGTIRMNANDLMIEAGNIAASATEIRIVGTSVTIIGEPIHLNP